MAGLQDILDDPTTVLGLDNEQAYGFEPADVADFQIEFVRRHFAEKRPAISVVERLTADIGLKRIDDIQDVTAACLPHTMYKSYSASYVEQGRYDRMSKWLGSLTSIDISKIDVSACDSLDSWLEAIEQGSNLRPHCSSGTSGKVSFFPKDTTGWQYYIRNFVLFNSGFRDEQDSGLDTGEVDFFTPWPVATGRHNLPKLFGLLRSEIYKNRPGEHVHVMGKMNQSVEMLWLTGQLRLAERKGDLASLRLSPAMLRVQDEIRRGEAATAANVEPFIDDLMGRRGQRIFFFSLADHLIPLAQECKRRGVKAEFDPRSYFFIPGKPGMKGQDFPEGWLELCKEIFPFTYQNVYAMTESTAGGRRCSAGRYHMPPWIVLFLLDPDTSVPLPRTGTQTGRLALFDLTATTYWGGAITGDRATITWDGGCACGRKGPYVHDDIVRFINLRDDDKITCSKTPDAYEKVTKFVLGSIPET
ncbi:MAG TPA: hypothetical protein VKS60_05105 [Stellaceae bacterium]|nr:hypothetical protein [Stellaceae bacterium]